MEINVSRKSLDSRPCSALLYDYFQECADQLSNAVILFDFPVYKDFDGSAVAVQTLIVAPEYGIVVFAIVDSSSKVEEILNNLDHVVGLVQSRLLRNPKLKSKRTEINVPINCALFTNLANISISDEDLKVLKSSKQVSEYLSEIRLEQSLDNDNYAELMATLDGSKGLTRHKSRKDIVEKSKGYYAKALEDEIALFDNQQRYGFVIPTDGPQRIRGIAGSGKTVLLAMKAAITHLKCPEAKIVYTFYTKSLYQHVKRLITRFYRQFDDKDPDWNILKVMHAWGGRSYPGVYYEACKMHGVNPLTFSDSQVQAAQKRTTAFDIVCTALKENNMLRPVYDFMFIDEGQDFPASFIDLCRQITVNGSIVWAYDELQNIFNIKTPTQEEVFGRKGDGSPIAEIVEDTILYRSYRNPREIFLTAHALGFGIYSGRIVQMFEDKEHWEDTGYKVIEGTCKAGDHTIIERPEATSTRTISSNFPFDEIVRCKVFDSFDDEIDFISASIKDDLNSGLRADDIVISIVDDRNAKRYAQALEKSLKKKGVSANNTHSDFFGIVDFYIEGEVTISTVHKAKGNEAYQVYVVGADAIFAHPDIMNRNRVFTAITRAKAWVTITGVGPMGNKCLDEINEVSKYFPNLEFIYPSKKDIKTMHRDMTKAAKKRMAAERAIDEALKMVSPDEIRKYLELTKK